MGRDHRKLRVFAIADALAFAIYHATRSFPNEERYGLQSQLRRAAVSTVCNIVEGSARRSEAEYVHFLNVANGSTQEVWYLLDLTHRLGYLSEHDFGEMDRQARCLAEGLGALLNSLVPVLRGGKR